MNFFNKIYYGDEIELEYLGTTYFIQGFQSNGVFRIVVDYWNNIDGSEPEHDYFC